METTIEKAAALAKSISTERAQERLTLVSTQLEDALSFSSGLRKNLFDIEKPANDEFQRKITDLQNKREQLQKFVDLGARYRLMSMEPLTWRDKNGWPKLVIFGIDNPVFQIKVLEGSWLSSGLTVRLEGYVVKIEEKVSSTRTKIRYERRDFPPSIQQCYADVCERLIGLNRKKFKRGQWKLLTLACQFDGFIPDNVKEKITEARKFNIFEDIFIIAEPEHIEITERPVAITTDPLVVGFDGKQIWLITTFDLTTVEEAMASGFNHQGLA